MTKSAWVYRKLRNFRAGIEAGISCFKRAYGGGRCTWRGLDRSRPSRWWKNGLAKRWPSFRRPWVEVWWDRRRSAAV
jgi:hypothetical protein